MFSDIIFKPFKTADGYYVYDRYSNSVIKIPSEDYAEFEEMFDEDDKSAHEKLITKYQRKGVLKPSIIKEIRNPMPEVVLEEKLKNNLEQVVLQVTQNCNFRCEYCAYSGSYHNRKHNNKRMSWDTARRGLDFAVASSSNSYVLNISFYGGEPLLEMDLIKDCIHYMKTTYPFKKVGYIFTTNASLLNDDIIKILVDNNISTVISLDGPEEMHNNGRKLADGKGSFQIVYKNIKHLYDNYNDYYKKYVSYNAVGAPSTDIVKVTEFFNTDKYVKDSETVFTTVSTENSKTEIEYANEFQEYLNIQRFNNLLAMLGKIDIGLVPSVFRNESIAIKGFYRTLMPLAGTAPVIHPGGPCIPGVRKLYIDADGNFLPCEKLNELSQVTKIGSLDEGYNLSRVKELINIGKLTEDACKKCWNFYFCNICVAKCEHEGELCKETKLQECPKSRFNTVYNLMDICLLKANHYMFEG